MSVGSDEGLSMLRHDAWKFLNKTSTRMVSAAVVGIGMLMLYIKTKHLHRFVSEGDTDSDPPNFTPGARVRIVGLKVNVGLNGSEGTCRRWEPERGVWIVELDNGSQIPLYGNNMKSMQAWTSRSCVLTVAFIAGLSLLRQESLGFLNKDSARVGARIFLNKVSARMVGVTTVVLASFLMCLRGKHPQESIPEAGADDQDKFTPGKRVCVVGLKFNVEMNGGIGVCQKWESELAAWTIECENGARFSLRAVNLEAIEDVPGNDGFFLDVEFPPSDASLGTARDERRAFINARERKAIQWLRLPDVIKINAGPLANSAATLWGDISPQALSQGKIGNCWLLAAIAALAEFPSALRGLFVEEDEVQGRYVIRLFDMSKCAWELIEIDDYIPCLYEEDKTNIPHVVNDNLEALFAWEALHFPDGSRKPIPMKWAAVFGRPTGREMWAVLLEKAIAKFVGCYAWLAGGTEQFALTCLTGMPLVYNFMRLEPIVDTAEGKVVCANGHGLELSAHAGQWLCDRCSSSFTCPDDGKNRFRCHECDYDLCEPCTLAKKENHGKWQWFGAQYRNRHAVTMPCSSIRGDIPWLSDDGFWSRLQHYDARNYLMTVAITNFTQLGSQKGFYRRDGLVLGHAYTLLECRSAQIQSGIEEREVVEWIDQDGDLVGIERVGNCAYSLCNGVRWQPKGVQDTVQIINFGVSEDSEKFQGTDSMGVVFSGFIPKEKCFAAAQVWERTISKQQIVIDEPQLLTTGTRVRFKGLVKQAELNGRLGEILAMKSEETEDQPATYHVKLIIDIGHYDVGTLADEYSYWVAVAKRTNLDVVPGVPGARGGAVRLVLLRNPHGNGVVVTHADGTISFSTKWRGDWSDNSNLWEMYPEIAEQVGYEPSNDGRFWMSWEDFRRTFDSVAVLTKSMERPSSSRVFELEAHQYQENVLCLSLAKMVEIEEMQAASSTLSQDFAKACIVFDPFESLPAFLDDGTLDTRLRWLATKPGGLGRFLEECQYSDSKLGHEAVAQRISELNLEPALAPNGQI